MSVAMLPNSVERCSHAITILYNGNHIPYLVLLSACLSLFVHLFFRWRRLVYKGAIITSRPI